MRSDRNGTTLLHLLASHECVPLTGNNVPTHIFGRILDRCIGFTLSETTHTSNIIPDLLSYHFALLSTIRIPYTSTTDSKFQSRITIPDNLIFHFVTYISNWYKDFNPRSPSAFKDDLVQKNTTVSRQDDRGQKQET